MTGWLSLLLEYAHWPGWPARVAGRLPALPRRQRIVKWARWGILHSPQIHYTESGSRSGWLHARPHDRLPLDTDCSGFATLCYCMAGLADPNGLGYRQLGYTGTLLEHAKRVGRIVPTREARPGDLIVYGPGTGEHVAVIVEAGPDPLTVSHGGPGVHYIRVSQDGRQPQRVCRYL